MARAFKAAKPLQLATMMPREEAVAPQAGSTQLASDAGHEHPRLTSVTGGNLDASGEATIVFTRVFPTKPGLTLSAEENADNGALTWKVRSWTTDASGDYIGAVIKFYRISPLPTIQPVSGLLTAVITGVNAIVTALSGVRIDNATVGPLPFTAIAVKRSD